MSCEWVRVSVAFRGDELPTAVLAERFHRLGLGLGAQVDDHGLDLLLGMAGVGVPGADLGDQPLLPRARGGTLAEIAAVDVLLADVMAAPDELTTQHLVLSVGDPLGVLGPAGVLVELVGVVEALGVDVLAEVELVLVDVGELTRPQLDAVLVALLLADGDQLSDLVLGTVAPVRVVLVHLLRIQELGGVDLGEVRHGLGAQTRELGGVVGDLVLRLLPLDVLALAILRDVVAVLVEGGRRADRLGLGQGVVPGQVVAVAELFRRDDRAGLGAVLAAAEVDGNDCREGDREQGARVDAHGILH